MAKEYLVVLFPRDRGVLINGQVMGVTNTKLELESGLYEVTLATPPRDFTPEKIDVKLYNTASLMPMTIEFLEAG